MISNEADIALFQVPEDATDAAWLTYIKEACKFHPLEIPSSFFSCSCAD